MKKELLKAAVAAIEKSADKMNSKNCAFILYQPKAVRRETKK